MSALVLLGTLLLAPATGPERDAVVAQAMADRDELAGWLRGTGACRGGRVARHLAELLRARGLDAEFHPAGREGGYTVVHSGPRTLPVAAVLVAPVTACPGAPDDRDLQHGQPARTLWRAAALSAALTRVARAGEARARVVGLFLGGDGASRCGRDFVRDTWPGLARGAPVLDEGGLLRPELQPPLLLVEVAAPEVVDYELRAVGSEREAADALDRALALLDGVRQPAPADPLRQATLEAWQRAADPARATAGSTGEALDAAQHSRCSLGPRLDRTRAVVRCRLAPGVSRRQLSFDLFQRVKKLPVVLAHQPEGASRGRGATGEPTGASSTGPAAARERILALMSRTATARWPGLVATPVYQALPPCADEGVVDSPTLGVPLVPAGAVTSEPAVTFADGALLTAALLGELCGAR